MSARSLAIWATAATAAAIVLGARREDGLRAYAPTRARTSDEHHHDHTGITRRSRRR
jgi:hypothetical protein